VPRDTITQGRGLNDSDTSFSSEVERKIQTGTNTLSQRAQNRQSIRGLLNFW